MNGKVSGEETLAETMGILRETVAPPSLLPRVLTRVGVADSYVTRESPIGTVFVAYNARGVSAVMRAADAERFERAFLERFGRPAYAAQEPTLPHALGHRSRDWDTLFDLRGLSEFEQAVLRKTWEIPQGEVRPYAWVAREIGAPRAARAVGSALARNPIPLLIPCHRVVRAGGDVGQYAFGAESKRALLAAEGVGPAELDELPRQGVRYLGSATTRIYCFPTCRHARRISQQHRRPFHSEREARAAGFRPCAVCRPQVEAEPA